MVVDILEASIPSSLTVVYIGSFHSQGGQRSWYTRIADSEGKIEWATKATKGPEGRDEIAMGEEGHPQGL
jgi:hypothetical protein